MIAGLTVRADAGIFSNHVCSAHSDNSWKLEDEFLSQGSRRPCRRSSKEFEECIRRRSGALPSFGVSAGGEGSARSLEAPGGSPEYLLGIEGGLYGRSFTADDG